MGAVSSATGGRVNVQGGGGSAVNDYTKSATKGLNKQYSGFDYNKVAKDPVGAYKNYAGGGLSGATGNVHLPGILGDWQDKLGAGGTGGGGGGGDAPAPYHIDPGEKPTLDPRTTLYDKNNGGLSEQVFQRAREVNYTGGNTSALDAMRNQGLSQGSSPWMQMQLQKQGQDQQNAMNTAASQNYGSMANANANLASHGGLTGGAAERISRGAMQSLNANRQDIANQGMQARTGLGIADEQQKIGLLQNAAQGDLAQANIKNQQSQYNAAAQTRASELNTQNALAENERNNQYNQGKYGEQMKAYGAANTANAIGAGGAAGKKG